jgi:hypothetical protein
MIMQAYLTLYPIFYTPAGILKCKLCSPFQNALTSFVNVLVHTNEVARQPDSVI